MRNVRTEPFPNIFGWWKCVDDVFAFSTIEIEKKIDEIIYFCQLPEESCNAYYSRFKEKTDELKTIGRNLDDIYLGGHCLRGMRPENGKQANQLLFCSRLKCTMNNVYDICKYCGEMIEDPLF